MFIYQRFPLSHCCLTFTGGASIDIALKPLFETFEAASKNEGSKRGDMAATNRFIDSALLGIDAWIAKGNWHHGFGARFIQFRDSMQTYYLRVSGQNIRQMQANKSGKPLRTAENALYLYLKEPRRVDKGIIL